MSAFDFPFIRAANFPAQENVWKILKTSCQTYLQNFGIFTKPLLLPLVKAVLGAYACLILNYFFINAMTDFYGPLLIQNLGLLLAGILLISIGTLWISLNGCWEYVIYLASLNRNAVEAFCQQPIEIKPAYNLVAKHNIKPYKILLLIYLLLPILIFLVTSGLSGILFPNVGLENTVFTPMPALLGGGLAFLLLGCVLCAVVAFLLTFIFQLAAFEELPKIPLKTLQQSTQMVLKRWADTLGLQIILAIATLFVVPLLLVNLIRLLGVSHWIDLLHQWLIQLALHGNPSNDSSAIPIFQMLQSNLATIASACTDSLLSTLITALMLPLGTLAFAHLYWQIQLKPD